MQTPIGEIIVRNSYDEEVVKEVILEHGYERWGDIKLMGNVIDCGAHIGTFSALALFNGCEVTAIEPDPHNFELLKLNAPKAKLVQKALTTEDEAYLWIDPVRSELNKVAKSGLKVAVARLDDFITKPVDVLKMDIEGSEYEVIFSSEKLHMVHAITMEYHNGMENLGELLLFLSNKGFKFGWIGGQDFGHLQVKR